MNATHQELTDIYMCSSTFIFLSLLTCILAFFSMVISPFVFVSQMGYFLALSMITFYVLFHYVIIPCWILLSQYTVSEETHDEIEQCLKVYCGCIPPSYLPYYGWNRRYRNNQLVDNSKAATLSLSSGKWKQKSKKSRKNRIDDWLQNEDDAFDDHKIVDDDDDDRGGDEFADGDVIGGNNKSATASAGMNVSNIGNSNRISDNAASNGSADTLSTTAAGVENDLLSDAQRDLVVVVDFDPFVMIGTNQEEIAEAEPVICLYEGAVGGA